MHCHEQHRITAVVAGSGTLHTETADFVLRAGDLLVLTPGLRHRLAYRGEAPMHLLTVEFVPGPLLGADELPLASRVFAGSPVTRCPAAAAAEAASLLHRIRAEQRREKAACTVAIRAYLMSLLVLLYRRRLRGAAAPAGDNDALEAPLAEVKGYMESHFATAIRVSDLAGEAHLSVRQFTARFKRAFGDTPMRYLTRLRMAAAQELLFRSPMGVAEIARSVGYENLSHFYRTFVHHTGMSPGRYRRSPL